MDMVKDLMKDDKKKKERKGRSAMQRTASASTLASRQSTRSTRSTATTGSSMGADDPFHIKRVMKIQRVWEKVKASADPLTVGKGFLEKILPDNTEEQCKSVVEQLDCIVYLLGPDMDDDDIEDCADSLDHVGIPAAALGETFTDSVNTLLGGSLSEKEMEVMNNSMGMVLRDMVST